MRVICSYCESVMSPGDGDADEVSHGMCSECMEHFHSQWEGQTLAEYLDRFPVPIMVVGNDAHVMAMNRQMGKRLDVDEKAAVGRLGGDAMECVRARLPGGCGRTEHCKTCSLRRVVQTTLQAKTPQRMRTALLERDSQRLRLVISTEYVDDAVVVHLEDEWPHLRTGSRHPC